MGKEGAPIPNNQERANDTPPEDPFRDTRFRRAIDWIVFGGLMGSGSSLVGEENFVQVGATITVLGGLELARWAWDSRKKF